MKRIYQPAIIERIYRGGNFRCRLQDHENHKVNAYPCGQMRKNRITLCAGDLVTVELSPYDLHRGRVIWRRES